MLKLKSHSRSAGSGNIWFPVCSDVTESPRHQHHTAITHTNTQNRIKDYFTLFPVDITPNSVNSWLFLVCDIKHSAEDQQDVESDLACLDLGSSVSAFLLFSL